MRRNITDFDHCCIIRANTNISTEEVLKYSQGGEREGRWEEEKDLIYSWPSSNIQIPSEGIIFFLALVLNKFYCSMQGKH